jgi:outer membrane protein OmpA-like peptidoglycan-associated protein
VGTKPTQTVSPQFCAGSTTLVKKSQSLFSEIKLAIKERTPCDINIIGHADRSGSKKYNIELSLRRAEQVHDWLVKGEIDIENIVVESYGEEDPIIPTADGVAEPRNRRVELLIR